VTACLTPSLYPRSSLPPIGIPRCRCRVFLSLMVTRCAPNNVRHNPNSIFLKILGPRILAGHFDLLSFLRPPPSHMLPRGSPGCNGTVTFLFTIVERHPAFKLQDFLPSPPSVFPKTLSRSFNYQSTVHFVSSVWLLFPLERPHVPFVPHFFYDPSRSIQSSSFATPSFRIFQHIPPCTVF